MGGLVGSSLIILTLTTGVIKNQIVCFFHHCGSSAFTHQAGKEFGTQDTHGRNCTSVKKTESNEYKIVESEI